MHIPLFGSADCADRAVLADANQRNLRNPNRHATLNGGNSPEDNKISGICGTCPPQEEPEYNEP